MQEEFKKLNDNINELIIENSNLIKKLNEKEIEKKNERNTGFNNILNKFENELKTINQYS